MAAQTMLQDHYLALTDTVKQWDQRLRLRQTLLWLPRSLMPGLVLGIVIALLARVRPLLQTGQIALIAGVGAALGAVVMLCVVWLWRRPALTSARRFDVLLRLNERVSTALEISAGTIHTNDELARRQLEDARTQASAVRIGDHLPLTLYRNDWLIAAILALVLALLLILPNAQASALTQAAAQQVAITEAADTLRDLTEDVAANAALSDAERRALLEELQSATNSLEQQNVTPEEAFAAVSDVQNSLETRANDLNSQAQANQNALQQAANALRQAGQQQSGTNSSQSASASMEQISQSLDDIAQNADSMNDAERQAAEQALRDAAATLQGTNPQAAQQLIQAAQNMTQNHSQQGDPQQGDTQSGDPQSAQQAQENLQQAQQQMQEQAQQTEQQQDQAQSLQNAADQAQQSAEQISQAQQSQQQSQQEQTDQQGQPQGQSQPQQGQQSPNQQPQGQPQQAQQGQPQNQAGDQQAQQAQSVQNAPGQSPQSGDQQQGAMQQSPNASSGAGDTEGGAGDDSPGTQQQNSPSQASNNPDGQGEHPFESVNVPRHIGAQANDGNNVELNTDASGAPVQEGNFSENPNGQVTVPYNQVFSDYADAANRALNRDYVPLGLRDVVRDYFTSLEPKP